MTTVETDRVLAERYGRSRPKRRWWILGGALAVLLVGYVAWATLAGAFRSVDFDTTGFTVDDAHSVTVHFQVVAPPGTSVACAIEAQDPEHGVVGWRVVDYPGGSAHTRAFEVSLPTTAEATTGLASSCWIP